ncbi:MAG: agmatinase [Parcubacteria group bacterium Gr01-1014_48]|nr:MAG: agmatinase [Parcubacteria group bacterium Greene0416_14]TSC73757.1 MAG: agmatinase [Parcubacteria group bacterium Gr01-1014_48]TSD01185.1 MAG: agmatinase [Parcubacteria group bacterium Greene1014_15]
MPDKEERSNPKTDQAFTADSIYGLHRERTYGGALSFLRRIYTKKLRNIDIAIVGIPYDLATSDRPGARFGPRALRAASVKIANSIPWPWGFDPTNRLAISDYGDIGLDFGYPDLVPQQIESQARKILKRNVSIVALGGDHFISLPLLRAYAARFGKLALVHFDAHSDSWQDVSGRISHGTMFYHAVKEGLIDPEHSIQIGIRTYNKDPLGIQWLEANWIHEHRAYEAAYMIQRRVGSRPTYLTFDVDCLDPAFAPGTGTPVVGGLSTAQARAILHRLPGINFVGMDLVEVSPPYDVSEITALAGATIILDYLCIRAYHLPDRGKT